LAGLIPAEVVSQVQEATDIVELISQYLPLKRTGKNFKALCPFHQEKTPSFIVSSERQTFHCFGCGEGGNCFGFLMARERLSFPEAVRALADRKGIRIPETTGGTTESAGLRKRLFEVNEWACRCYVEWLASDSGRPARRYLQERGFSSETVKAWRLGLAPKSWSALLDRARGKGLSPDQLEKAGLAVRRDDGHTYDRFRGRLMFPILDVRERVVGFGARALDDEEVKYLNSPETPIFNKGKNLYGLSQARRASREDPIAVVEGYTDVLMAHQQGVVGVVATLGTALTPSHARVLKRYTERVVLVFDPDTAGERASERSLEIFVDAELAAGICTLPAGLDPCDYLAEHGVEAFRRQVAEAPDIFDYKLAAAAEALGRGAVDQATQRLDALLRLVAGMANPVRRRLQFDQLARKIEADLRLPESDLRARWQALQKTTRPSAGAQTPRRAEEVAAPWPPVEREFVALALCDAGAVPALRAEVAPDDLTEARLSRILAAAYRLFDERGEVDESRLISALQDPEYQRLIPQLVAEEATKGNFENRLQLALQRWREQASRRQAARSRDSLRQADAAGQADEARRAWDALKESRRPN